MKNIVALVDFTRICEAAIAQAGRIARQADSHLILLHISPKSEESKHDALVAELNVFAEILGKKPINLSLHVTFGDFLNVIGDVLKGLKTDLVVVGTHGIRGNERNLFSKNMALLLAELQMPNLVVQGQRSQAPSELNKWLIAGLAKSQITERLAWLTAAYSPELKQARETETVAIETEALDNDCTLIVWQGTDEKGMELILNHFGIPVLLL